MNDSGTQKGSSSDATEKSAQGPGQQGASESLAQLQARLDTSPDGLSQDEAQRRLTQYGYNELAEEKTGVTEYGKGFDFLGYHFQKSHGNGYKWPTGKAIKAFKDKIRRKTRRQQPKNVAMIVKEITPIIRGWGNYFKHGNVISKFGELDGWTRMRLRSFIEKKKWVQNWKYPNTHFEKLGLITLSDLLKYQQKFSFPE